MVKMKKGRRFSTNFGTCHGKKKNYLDLFVIVQPTYRARDKKDETSSRIESLYLYILEKNKEKYEFVKLCL